jgi:hypothetical protein
MNAILKTSFTLVFVASFVAPAFADSKRPWLHTPDDFSLQRSQTSTRVTRTYVAQPQAESRRAYSYEPAPSLKAGDKAVVAKDKSEMKIGDRAVATVPQGTQFTVVAVQGTWIGANVEQNGQKFSGWLASADLANSAVSAPALHPCP